MKSVAAAGIYGHRVRDPEVSTFQRHTVEVVRGSMIKREISGSVHREKRDLTWPMTFNNGL